MSDTFRSVQRMVVASAVIGLFGAGCSFASSGAPAMKTPLSRRYNDRPANCDIHSPAAPPCTYQTTPDGRLTAYVEGATPTNTSTVNIIVHENGGSDRIVYTASRSKDLTVWYTAGISDDGRFVYVDENTLHPEGGIPYINRSGLDRIDTNARELTRISTFNGGVLDVYAHKNLMILWMMDAKTKTEKVVLTDLGGNVLRTLYQGEWKDPDTSLLGKDFAGAYKEANIVFFTHAIISPDGTRAVLKAFKTTAWPELVLFDLKTGDRTVLDKIASTLDVDGWKDNQTLLLKSDLSVTSTYRISE